MMEVMSPGKTYFRTPFMYVGAGFGAGLSYGDCKYDFENPYVKKVVREKKEEESTSTAAAAPPAAKEAEGKH